MIIPITSMYNEDIAFAGIILLLIDEWSDRQFQLIGLVISYVSYASKGRSSLDYRPLRLDLYRCLVHRLDRSDQPLRLDWSRRLECVGLRSFESYRRTVCDRYSSQI